MPHAPRDRQLVSKLLFLSQVAGSSPSALQPQECAFGIVFFPTIFEQGIAVLHLSSRSDYAPAYPPEPPTGPRDARQQVSRSAGSAGEQVSRDSVWDSWKLT